MLTNSVQLISSKNSSAGRIAFQFFIFFFSIVFVLSAPPVYSYNYCLLAFIAYLVENIIYFAWSRCSLFSFQGFFAIAFLLTNFIYPIFYYPYSPYIGLFKYDFDENIISYATGIALFAYNLYFMGIISAIGKVEVCRSYPVLYKSSIVRKNLLLRVYPILLLLFVTFVLTGGLGEIRDVYGGDEFGGTSFISKVLTSLIQFISLVLLLYSFKLYRNHRTLCVCVLCGVFCISVVYLICGNRGLPLSILLLGLVGVNDNIRKFSVVEILSLIVVGIFLLALIGYYRYYEETALDNMLEQKQSVFDFAMDLIICNRNLYSLISYADTNGCLFFLTKIHVLSFIPFAQSTICSLFDIDPLYTTSAAFNSYLTFGDIKGNLGLGTNIVSDIYVSFGVIGVAICFFGLGYIMQIAQCRSKMNLQYYLVYYLLVSDVVFMCRGSMFEIIKLIVWIMLFDYLRSKIKELAKK